jgi:hypothetical protein
VYNLRPDRVITVIGRCGTRYFLIVGVWAVTVLMYSTGHWGTVAHAISLMSRPGAVTLPVAPWLAYSLLLGGIYLMHYFCWQVGLLYREHHGEFPWILQQHVRSQKWQEYMMRRRPQYVQKPPLPVQQQLTPAAPVKPVRVQPVHPQTETDDGPRRHLTRAQPVQAEY